jgi:hypothetical protein
VSADFDSVGNPVNVLCDDGNGGTTACAGAPSVFLGRTTPKLEGAFGPAITISQRVQITGLLDFKTGYKKLDGNTRVRCTFFGGRCRENFFPAEGDPVRVAEINSNRQFVDFLITNASFAKWRELTLQYAIPDRYLRVANVTRATIAVSGRNLHTWTKYQGFEPEAMFLGGSRGGNAAWEQTTLPQLTSWIVSLNLGF